MLDYKRYVVCILGSYIALCKKSMSSISIYMFWDFYIFIFSLLPERSISLRNIKYTLFRYDRYVIYVIYKNNNNLQQHIFAGLTYLWCVKQAQKHNIHNSLILSYLQHLLPIINIMLTTHTAKSRIFAQYSTIYID